MTPLRCDKCKFNATYSGFGWQLCDFHYALFIVELERDRLDELALDERQEAEREE